MKATRRAIIVRRLVLLLLAISAGAVVNVAVAWGYAICVDIYPAGYKWLEGLGFTWDCVPSRRYIEWRTGFPMRSLMCAWEDGEVVKNSSISITTPLPDKWAFKGDYAYIPVQPLWPGFAINTIFYAAILWLFFAAPGRLRRWRRIKRGLCPNCAYPVGASELCTECGKRVKGALT